MAALVDAAASTKTLPAPRSLDAGAARRPPGGARRGRRRFRHRAGETVGLLGESGCGKTTTGPAAAASCIEPTSGSIALRRAGHSPSSAGDELRGFRRQAQLVFQNPFDALNPRLTIGRALAEPLVNTGVPRGRARRAHARCAASACASTRRRALSRRAIPHELSGGQLQRIVHGPRADRSSRAFLVADEPVSMLDVSVRAGILNLMREAAGQHGPRRALHQPRPRAGALCLPAHAGHVSRRGRRGRPDRGGRPRAAATPTPARWSRPCRCRASRNRAPRFR